MSFALQEFKSAIAMLNAAKTELQRHENIPVKLSKLIDHEILLFQISQTLDEWPKKIAENQTMISKCKQCLTSVQNGETRAEILDACAAMLLNLNETTSLTSLEKRFPSSDLYTAVASAIVELDQYKTNAIKKVCREAWDLVLAMFSTNTNAGSGSGGSGSGGGNTSSTSGTGKRGVGQNTGGANIVGNITGVRDSPTTIIVSTNLLPFLRKLRDPLRK